MPGHCYAAIRALPDLLEPEDTSEYESVQGFRSNTLNPGLDFTYTFMRTVLEWVAELFPSPRVHIGCDEVPRGVWKGSPACQQAASKLGYEDVRLLGGHLLRFAQGVLSSKGKRLCGWEEAFSTDAGGEPLAHSAVCWSWTGEEKGVEAARAGYDVVQCPAARLYLDLAQDSGFGERGLHWAPEWAGLLPLHRCYSYEPADALGPEAARLLGIQANLWGETVDGEERMDFMLLPRLLAVAERAWSPKASRDFASFEARAVQLCRHLLVPRGFGHHPLGGPPLGTWHVAWYQQDHVESRQLCEASARQLFAEISGIGVWAVLLADSQGQLQDRFGQPEQIDLCAAHIASL